MGKSPVQKNIPTLWKNLLVGAVWLLIWQLCCLAMGSEVLIPAPLSVLRRLGQLALTLSFWTQVGLSLVRITAGFLLALGLGVLLGGLTARCPLADALFSPALRTVRAIPVASFIILLFVLMSKEHIPTVTAFLMVLPVVWANMDRGVRQTDPQLLEMAAVFRLSPGKTLLHIWVPQVTPFFLSAAQTGMGLAWKAGVAAEVLAAPRLGIGRALYEAKVYLETADLFAWTAVTAWISLLLEKGLLRLMRRFGHET